jgi:O-antigen/teichoic acid export membrane protein
MSSQEQKKIFLLGTTSSYGTNIVSIIVGLISVPLGLHYFGPIRYGIWAVISSVVAYLSISNLGITTAAATLTAKASKPFEQWAVLRRSLLLLVISSTVVLSLILGIAHFYPDWVVALGKIPVDLHREAAEAAIAVAILFLLNLPISIFSAGFIGFQKLYWERFYASLTIIVGLVALILTVFLIKGNLVILALFRGFATLLVSIICASHFLFTHSELRQKFNKLINREFSIKSIFTSGIRFFIIGIAAMVVWNTDNLIISHFLGVKAVTPYAITFRLFAMLFSIFTAINITLFPMYGKAAGLKQWDWIQRTYQKATQLLPIIGGLVWVGGVVFAKNIIDIWAGPDAYGGMLVVFALGGYGYLLSMVNIHSFLLIGLNATKSMVFISWAEAIGNLGISIALVGLLGIGGVALGTFLGSLVTVSWMLPRDVCRQTKEKVKFHFRPVMRHAFFILIPCLIMSTLIQLYWQNEISKVLINIIIIAIYLALSWCGMPIDLRNLVKNTLAGLRARLFVGIQSR